MYDQENWDQNTYGAGGFPFVSLSSNPGGQFALDVLTTCSSAVCSDACHVLRSLRGHSAGEGEASRRKRDRDSYTLPFKN